MTTTPELTKAALVTMIVDSLNEQNKQIDKTECYWVVQVGEELPAPRATRFENSELAAEHLRTLVGKPGWVYVFQGYRCGLSIGDLPTLFTRDGVVPLFNVTAPLLSEDGAMTIPAPPEQIPEGAVEGQVDAEDVDDDIEDPSDTVPFEPAILPVPPEEQESPDGPDVLGDS